jgi:polyisoprenoid-binding protein YceI
MTTTVLSTPTATWQIDPAHTHADFAVKHLMISTVRGQFTDIQGTVSIPEGNLPDAKIDVRINVASIDTRVADRDTHLRSADFFDVEHFPFMTFTSTRIVPAKNGTYQATGLLTIRGNAREVTLSVESNGQVRDPWGNDRAGFSASGTINRKEFGLVWNMLLEAGGVAVGDEVKIAIEAELTRPAVAVAA